MTARASGEFRVILAPLPQYNEDAGAMAGRMSIDKVFSGDLDGTSKGEMLTAMTAVKGSAGYVAIERVTGRLAGRGGTFVLQHSSTMERGAARQSIVVVPDSGTGELEGLRGSMTIVIEGARHGYVFDYDLAPAG